MPIDLGPPNHVPVALSLVAVYVFCGLLPAALFVGAALRSLRAWVGAARALVGQGRQSRLQPGPAVLCGTVHYVEGQSVAVRMQLTLTGFDSTLRGEQYHRWSEVDRRVTAVPFYIDDVRGARVRVEPPPNVVLVDRLDTVEAVSQGTRVVSGALLEGETAYAAGVLALSGGHEPSGPYRGAASMPVLRASAGGRMLLSSAPLRARFVRRAVGNGLWALVLAVVLVGLQAASLPYQALFWTGRVEEATIVSVLSTTARDKKGRAVPQHSITVQISDGTMIKDSISADWLSMVREGSRVFVLRTPALGGWTKMGSEATINAIYLIIPLFPVVLLFFGYRWWRRAYDRPWYEGVLELNGSGHLSPRVLNKG